MRRQSSHIQPCEDVSTMSACLNTTCPETAAAVSIDDAIPLAEEPREQDDAPSRSQTESDVPFDTDKFMFDDEAIHYYTGLENYSKVMFVLSTLGHAAYNLSYYAL